MIDFALETLKNPAAWGSVAISMAFTCCTAVATEGLDHSAISAAKFFEFFATLYTTGAIQAATS
jgi:hypothetical protein